MIGIVTVLYNSSNVLNGFFNSLTNQIYKDFKLYIIDNNSSDDSAKIAAECLKSTSLKGQLFVEKNNWGIAKGNNIGIKAAIEDGCEYILLANNDIEFPPETINELLIGLINNNADLVVPKMYFFDKDIKRFWAAGGNWSWLKGYPNHIGYGELEHGQYDKDRATYYAPTCFMLIKANVFSTVGFMDENYFVYWDDTDFDWRAVQEKKLKMFYIFKSVIFHKIGFSSGGSLSDFTIKYTSRNRIYFILKHFSLFHSIVVFLYLFLHTIIIDKRSLTREKYHLKIASYKEGWLLYKNSKH